MAHPARDGYVTVRLLVPLKGEIPSLASLAWRCYVDEKENARTAYVAGRYRPSRHSSDEFWPDDWRNGEFLARIHSGTAYPDFNRSLLKQAQFAANLWKVQVPDDLRQLAQKEAYASTSWVEILGVRVITLSCHDCINQSINTLTRAALVVCNALQVATFYGDRQLQDLLTPMTVQPYIVSQITTQHFDGTVDTVHPLAPVMPFIMTIPPSEIEEERAATHPEGFSAALRAISREYIFSRHTELMAEAADAAFVRGQYAQGLMVAGQASEYLLDTLLLFMMWWEGREPAEAAHDFRDNGNMIMSRVRNLYHPRLGDGWNPNIGVLLEWRDTIARKRNRVIHGGSRVSRDEAKASIDVTRQLREFLISLTAAEGNILRYPPLHAMLCGDELVAQNYSGMREEEFYRDRSQSLWRFQAWTALFHGELGLAPPPSVEQSEVLITRQKSGGTEWWLYDPNTHKAALANPRSINRQMRNEIEGLLPAWPWFDGIRRPYVRLGIMPRPDLQKGAKWQNATQIGPGLDYRSPWLN